MSNLPPGPSLNVGSGPMALADWICLDGSWQALLAGSRLARLAAAVSRRQVGHWPPTVRHQDIRKGLPFPDASVAVVYSSHFLEHLYRSDAVAFLREARRVLKPGGVCRAVVPDSAAAVRQYCERGRGLPGASDAFMETLILHDREAPGRGPLEWYRRLTAYANHKWMYDAEGLVGLFHEAGFASPRSCGFLESAIPVERLRCVEQESRVLNGNGICAEART